MTFILLPDDPIPDGYYPGDWLDPPVGPAWQFVDTLDQVPGKAHTARRNPQWSTKVSGADPSAVLTATTSTRLDSDEWGLAWWDYAPSAFLDEVLFGIRVPQHPKISVISYIGVIYLAGGFPPGAEGIQMQELWLTPTGPARLEINMTSGTHVLSKEFYTLNFYEAVWSDGPQWAPSGGSTTLVSPAVEAVATAAARPFYGRVVGPTNNAAPGARVQRIALPDFSTFQQWNDGTGDYGLAVKGLIRAAVEGTLPPFGTDPNAVFLSATSVGGAGCELMMKFVGYRWIYPIVYQRSYPRDDGKGDSAQRSYPPPVDSLRSYPHIP